MSILRNDRTKLLVLALACIAVMIVFMVIDSKGNWEYILPRRGTRLLAITLTAILIASSTVVFQTITQNRILTPSITGLDSLYLLIHTTIVFLLGSSHWIVRNANANFIVGVGMMSLFSVFVYRVFFRQTRDNIYFLLLIGIILGTLFQSLSTFMQVMIDPNEFLVVQDRMFASFTRVKTQLLVIACAASVLVAVYCVRDFKFLDVLAMGRAHAINLGVDHDRVVRRLLTAIFIAIAISTALVGPITFLGLLVANIAYEIISTYRRNVLIVAAVLISILALVGGQILVEHVFTFSTTLSVIINLIGGGYFLYLLLKERTTW